MIEVKNLTKSFGKKCVLNSVSMRFLDGSVSFVLGKSGVGKSVLLKHLVGLMAPDSGEIFIDDKEITAFDEVRLTEVRRTCGMVFQFPALLDSLTIFENVVFGLRSQKKGLSEIEMRKIAIEKLRLVHLGSSILEKFPMEISFGEQKRVSIARTLAVEPKYLLFDEPTTSMDPVTTNALTKLIADLSKTLNVTSIVVSHDLESAFKIADRMILLSDGLVAVDGTKEEIRKSASPLARAFMTEMERYHD